MILQPFVPAKCWVTAEVPSVAIILDRLLNGCPRSYN
jgi:hypothetical protein